MDNPRADKVAVVDEVRDRLEAADGAVLTEYRGLTVSELAELRRELIAAGGDYKIYKNTLVRLAVADSPQAGIADMLTGPTAIAFVHGDVSAVAKALRDFGRRNPSLLVKGGLVESGLLSARELEVLADLPPRDTLLAQVAGGLAAPMQGLGRLIEALPRQLAYGFAALIEKREAAGEARADEVPSGRDGTSAPVADAAAHEAVEADTTPESGEADTTPESGEADTTPKAGEADTTTG